MVTLLELVERPRVTTRRSFLKRAAIIGMSVPVAGSLLAACGGGDDDDDDEGSGGDSTSDEPEPTTPPATSAADEPETTAQDDEPTAAGDSEATTTEADSSTGGEPQQGGTFIVMVASETTSLSPDDSGVTDRRVLVGNIHNGLLFMDAYYEFQPDLAESFEIADDGLQYTFKLHEGVKFHDGETLTSEDVKYTFEYYGDPDNATINATLYADIDTIETPDDLTVIINMLTPNASFLDGAGDSYIVPSHHHSEIGEEAYKADPIGTGPFKLKERHAATFTELEAFDDYFKGRPILDIYRVEVIPEASVAAVRLANNEADAYIRDLVPEDVLRFRDDPQFSDYTVRVTSSLQLQHFPMDLRLPKFQDKAVRQAMMHALNRDQLIEDILFELATKATAHSSQSVAFYYEPDVKDYPYDPELAMTLLDEAGWIPGGDGIREKDGVKLSWVCTIGAGDQVRGQIVLVAQQEFQAIGLDMQIEEAPFSTVLDGLIEGGTEMSLFGNTYGATDPNATQTMNSDARANWSNWHNERADELLALGMQETDPDERKQYYSELQQLVAEEVPFLFLWFLDRFDIFTPRVQGIPEEPLGYLAMYLDANEIWLQEGD